MGSAMAQIPVSFYATVGVLIVTNFSIAITFVVFIFKAGLFVAETKGGIKEAKEIGVRCHKRVDKVADKLGEVI